MAKILVTGGCGYIGSHVVKALSESKHQPIVIDNLSTGFRDALLYDEPLIVGDLADKSLLDRVFREHRIDAIMHFAASIVVPESVEDPLKYYRNNTVNLVNLLDVAAAHKVHAIIFSSTASVYGNGDGISAFTESQAAAPESPYGSSKYFSEQIIRDLSKASPLRHVILRYFNVAGADPGQRIGQRSPRATHLIKTACETAVGKRPGMMIYGDDYGTPDGTCIRDYIHISDLASAHVLALDYLLGGGESKTLNCGYGKGYSVKEVLAAVDKVVGRPLKVTIGPRRPGDAVRVLAEPREIHEILPWNPKYQDIHTIVEHAYLWEQKLLAMT